jgi:hypothetical protein
MTVAPPRPLADHLRAGRRTTEDARAAIGLLALVAHRLADDEAARVLGEAAGRLAADTYALMALGRFNAGKSTLINALLAGRGFPADGVVPVGAEATTPTLIRLEYAEKPYVRILQGDGGYREPTFEQFRTGHVLDSREDRNAERFGDVVTCNVGMPVELLRQRLTLYDTPGTADTLSRDETTRAALLHCDAAIAVYRMGEYGFREVAAERLARAEHVQIFTVINTFGAPVTAAGRESAWNKLVLPRTGVEYAEQSLAAQHIHFIDARAALHARSAGADTFGTGLDDLEDDLAAFLLTERQRQHVSRYLHLAVEWRERLTATCRTRAIECWTAVDHAEQRRRTLEQERQRLRTMPDDIVEAVRTAERQADGEIKRDFAKELDVIGLELALRLPNTSLPSWKAGGFLARRLNAVNRSVLVRELADQAQRYAIERLRDWSTEMAEEVRFRAAQAIDEAAARLAALGSLATMPDTWSAADPAGRAGLIREITLPERPPAAWEQIGDFVRREFLTSAGIYSMAIVATMDVTVSMDGLATEFLDEPWTQLRTRLTEYERHLLLYSAATFGSCDGAVREHTAKAVAGMRARLDDDMRGLNVRIDTDRAELIRLNDLAADLDRAGAALTAATGAVTGQTATGDR